MRLGDRATSCFEEGTVASMKARVGWYTLMFDDSIE
jgi:hypothetical protein